MSCFLSPEERLAEIEAILSVGRRRSVILTDRQVRALKDAAADLRGRSAAASSLTLRELQRRIADAAASRTALGWDHGALVGIGQELITRWKVVRQALERFGRQAEEDRAPVNKTKDSAA